MVFVFLWGGRLRVKPAAVLNNIYSVSVREQSCSIWDFVGFYFFLISQSEACTLSWWEPLNFPSKWVWWLLQNWTDRKWPVTLRSGFRWIFPGMKTDCWFSVSPFLTNKHLIVPLLLLKIVGHFCHCFQHKVIMSANPLIRPETVAPPPVRCFFFFWRRLRSSPYPPIATLGAEANGFWRD